MKPEDLYNFIYNIDFEEDSLLLNRRLECIDTIHLQNEESTLICNVFDKYIENIDQITLSKLFKYIEFEQLHSEKIVEHILKSIFENKFTNEVNIFLAFEFCLRWTTPSFFKKNYPNYFADWKKHFSMAKTMLPFLFIKTCFYFDDFEPIFKVIEKQLAVKGAFPQVLITIKQWFQMNVFNKVQEITDKKLIIKSNWLIDTTKKLAPLFSESEFKTEFSEFVETVNIQIPQNEPPYAFQSSDLRSNMDQFVTKQPRSLH